MHGFRTVRQLIELAEGGAFEAQRPTPARLRINYVLPRHAAILEVLRAAGQPLTAAQVAERLGRGGEAVRNYLTQMQTAKLVRRVGGPPSAYVPQEAS